jgi:hypothetical protein
MKKLPAILAFTLVLIAGLAYFVWPTRYRYDHLKLGANDFPVRIDRIDGETEVFFPGGWRKQTETAPKVEADLPPWDLSKISGDANMYDGAIHVQVYNGSKYTISEMLVSISVFDANHTAAIKDRVYRLTPYEPSSDLSPLSSGQFSARVGLYLQTDQTWEFSITGAKGTLD